MATVPIKSKTGEYPFVNPNILQMDEPRDVQEYTVPVSIRCPHCMQIGMFQNVLQRSVHYSKMVQHPSHAQQKMVSQLHAATRVCPNQECKGLVLVVQRDNQTLMKVLPSPKLDFTPDGIPSQLVATLKEAIECHSAEAFRAAAMMVRRLMEELCEEQGAKGDNLHKRLNDLKGKVPMTAALFDGAMELKVLGNDAAHVEARAYASIGQEEAEVSIEVAKEIMKTLYQHKGLVERLQKLKST